MPSLIDNLTYLLWLTLLPVLFDPLPGVGPYHLLQHCWVSVEPPRPWADLERDVGVVLAVALVDAHQLEGVIQSQQVQELQQTKVWIPIAGDQPNGYQLLVEITKFQVKVSIRKCLDIRPSTQLPTCNYDNYDDNDNDDYDDHNNDNNNNNNKSCCSSSNNCNNDEEDDDNTNNKLQNKKMSKLDSL